MTEIEPGYDPCRMCGADVVEGAQYCDCEYDERGNVEYDCGQCSKGLIYVKCDDRFKGLELSISVFY
jgi:hypothetical protein